jgi:hypothetical protein
MKRAARAFLKNLAILAGVRNRVPSSFNAYHARLQ